MPPCPLNRGRSPAVPASGKGRRSRPPSQKGLAISSTLLCVSGSLVVTVQQYFLRHTGGNDSK